MVVGGYDPCREQRIWTEPHKKVFKMVFLCQKKLFIIVYGQNLIAPINGKRWRWSALFERLSLFPTCSRWFLPQALSSAALCLTVLCKDYLLAPKTAPIVWLFANNQQLAALTCFWANYEGWMGQREGQSQNASNCLLLLVLVNLGGIEFISIEERSHHHNTALVVRSRSGISVVSLAWYQRKRSVWRVLGISNQCGHISGLEYTHRSPPKSATP